MQINNNLILVIKKICKLRFMKKIFIIIIFTVSLFEPSLCKDLKNLKSIEMDVLRNGEIIGFSNYKFEKENNFFKVKNITSFNVEILGVNLLSINSSGTEVYKNNKLISFNSKTFQNKKIKYVNLKLSNDKKQYSIDGSSYKGNASLKNVVGNWWNYEILKTDSQISPLSGSIKKQKVKYLGDEVFNFLGKNIKTQKFSLKSEDEKISDDKKLNFTVWIEPNSKVIFKVAYERMGNWEYKLKNYN